MQSVAGTAVYAYSSSEVDLKRSTSVMGFVKTQKRIQNVMQC